ncbi:hypothetical protein [Streptomyces sp. NBC_01477]|uniref:hypothetical protein n=1 Tax=Streptomyces sp. NBC_01477 TaxID=2976015 RepID=UPI002E2F2631|nr:hypothetical protein [Streptomyces sp. NBC_01477]
MGTLVNGFIEPIAKRWSTAMSGPLLLFWLAGTLVVYWPRGTGSRPCHDPAAPAKPLCALAHQGAAGAALASASATTAVVISAWILTSSATFVLEVLAGRWGTTRFALACTRYGITRHARRRIAFRAGHPTPSGVTGERLAAWQVQNGWRNARRRAALARYPRLRDPDPLMPTTLGNALVSVPAEIRRQYGLDLRYCWDPFVRALEPSVREELTAAATRVLARVQGVICAVATAVWCVLLPGWWPRLVWLAGCAALTWGAHRALRAGVNTYCCHVRDLFTLHRARLYRALAFALPATTVDEVPCGETLSMFLSRSVPPASAPVTYSWPPA